MNRKDSVVCFVFNKAIITENQHGEFQSRAINWRHNAYMTSSAYTATSDLCDKFHRVETSRHLAKERKLFVCSRVFNWYLKFIKKTNRRC